MVFTVNNDCQEVFDMSVFLRCNDYRTKQVSGVKSSTYGKGRNADAGKISDAYRGRGSNANPGGKKASAFPDSS